MTNCERISEKKGRCIAAFTLADKYDKELQFFQPQNATQRAAKKKLLNALDEWERVLLDLKKKKAGGKV